MFEPFNLLCFANKPASAAAHGFAFFALCGRTADRAGGHWLKWCGVVRATVKIDAHYLWDHIACALDHDGITNAYIFAGDLILIMQCGVGHHDSTNIHRGQACDRRERASAPHLNINGFYHGFHLLRRELERDRPAR